jgi:1,4-dihydroxy-2-naphthoyl-CoA hydrolase
MDVPSGQLMDRIGLEILEAVPGRVVARIPVEGNLQPYGLLHGGATASLCESVGSLGAALMAGEDRFTVGIQLSVNHVRAVREGHITATGEPIHSGSTTAVWDIRVHDDERRLVAVARLTLAVRDRSP